MAEAGSRFRGRGSQLPEQALEPELNPIGRLKQRRLIGVPLSGNSVRRNQRATEASKSSASSLACVWFTWQRTKHTADVRSLQTQKYVYVCVCVCIWRFVPSSKQIFGSLLNTFAHLAFTTNSEAIFVILYFDDSPNDVYSFVWTYIIS